MNFEEHIGKKLLQQCGIAIPASSIATNVADAAQQAATQIATSGGKCAIKAQVPSGKRGKAGGIAIVSDEAAAQAAAAKILGMEIGGYKVESLLVEEAVDIKSENYLAIMNDSSSKSPLVLFSRHGGMSIEESSEQYPDELLRFVMDIDKPLDVSTFTQVLKQQQISAEEASQIAAITEKLFKVYMENDAELLEINPLVQTQQSNYIALDCKFTMDDSAIPRQEELTPLGSGEKQSPLEKRGKELGIRYIELDGDVGVLANGAGLTMATMDAIAYHGGKAANFLEIGGEAYRLGEEALELVLDNPKVTSLLVNFCGAFARTDVMVEGIITAWKKLNPQIPVFFSIHGTGDKEAVAMVQKELNINPYPAMNDAVAAAVKAAKATIEGTNKPQNNQE